MNRLFRKQRPGLSGYLALALFAAAYVAALAVVVAPEGVRPSPAGGWNSAGE